MDNLSKKKRSKIMAAIKSFDTRPEIQVRHLVSSLGFRYRLHCSQLPGKPDLVFPSRRKVIFVHGCFWHVHRDCVLSHIPKYEYWRQKLAKNTDRDRAVMRALTRSGWKSLVLWECELSQLDRLSRKIVRFLDPLAASKRDLTRILRS